MQDTDRKQIKRVADHLEDQKNEILESWKQKIKKNDTRTSRLIHLSRDKFFNHMPVFIDNLIRQFRGETEKEKEAGQKHGEHRWDYGLNLKQLTKEWSVLHEVLIENLSICFVKHSFNRVTIQEIQKTIAQNIHRGIKDSVDRYSQLENYKAETQLRDLKEALQKREKQINSHHKGLRQTSHDVKGNLMSLQIAVSMLQDPEVDEKEKKEIIEDMAVVADSLGQLLNELLNLFRLKAGQKELEISSFDVASELTKLCESMRLLAEKEGLDLECSGEEPLPVKGDRKKVRRVAQNLLLNALKYTESGRVEINWESENDEQWKMSVSDTGPGLSQTNAASLTAKESAGELPGKQETALSDEQADSKAQRHGEGIGLLIVRELCQLMNAVIEVETSEGEGTTFEIYFPVNLSTEE